ncbi:isopenicillin N synthase family oxygenase [Rhodococcus sp. IEGM 248]|uniref:isopenicillin N synthase family dioxygenase n=1 Tax=Rhodococcus opacus TaxID=37919 RepID=UPI0013C225D0|nr:2-oxoglutarate and iron-dependent oxygenase domain-containing protein [Rhodococcus opacus]MDV7090182.1 2-oxoglutarate and iron-dependent oxygenase domain-containing protein [Rhodococcus opacus]NDV10524.1 isopenicillin N synthase family oxygenase [Rhodococcus sp. IEGM 248]
MTILDVPLIDISAFRDGSDEGRRRVADEVERACRDIGFLVITGHGVDPKQIESVYGTSKEFFALPLAQKSLVSRPDPSHIRGYSGMGTEALAQLDEDEPAPPDLKEIFDVGPTDVPADDDYYTAGGAAFAPNVWPQQPDAMQEQLTGLFGTMTDAAHLLGRVFAAALGIESDYFRSRTDKHTSIMRVNFYPRQEEPALHRQMRGGAHTDYTAFTVLWQEDVPSGGLQVLNKAGNWVDVPYVPGSLVVNIGDSLARWTNDRWVSTYHRVVNPAPKDAATTDRVSIVFFFQPNYDAVIECIPTCQSELNPARYAPIRNGDYLAEKFAQQQITQKESA